MPLFEQDFLMRQIQQLTQLLQQIIFKKNQNKPKEAVQEIEHALQKLTRDKPKEFNELNLEETLTTFTNGDRFESELALAVADLLKEQGDSQRHAQFSKSQKAYLQALLLYKKARADKEAAVPIDIQQKIEFLEQKVSSTEKVKEINRLLA